MPGKMKEWWAAQREANAKIKVAEDAAIQRRKDAEEAELGRQREMARKLLAAHQEGTIRQFPALKVQAAGAEVLTLGEWRYGKNDSRLNESKPLGPLAGAEAQVSDGTTAWSPGKALIMPIALTALATKQTAQAFVILTNGTVHTVQLDGSRAILDAQREAVEFNAMVKAQAYSVKRQHWAVLVDILFTI
jgi:hypothetical protein